MKLVLQVAAGIALAVSAALTAGHVYPRWEAADNQARKRELCSANELSRDRDPIVFSICGGRSK